jgi:thymidylate synthase (FAD)
MIGKKYMLNETVELYGDNIGSIQLIDYMGDDARAVQAARVSFLKDEDTLTSNGCLDKKDRSLAKFLLREKHTSPFEHSCLSFRIKVPLFIRSQIMRHRTFSYNEVSRRYTDACIEFHIPAELRKQADTNLQCSTNEVVDTNDKLVQSMRLHVDSSYRVYQMLLDCGVCREQARAVLPQNMYTTFYMTGNLLNWIKFLQLRLHPHAQPEVQELARGVLDIMREVFPQTVDILDELGVLCVKST